MAGVKTMLFLGIFVLFLAKSAESNECLANLDVSCESLRSSDGFTYTVPLNISCFGSCDEQGWYFQNETFIVDSTPNAVGERSPIVQDVTAKNLTVSVCENLQWQLNCGTCNCIVNYTVTDTKHSPAHDSNGNHNHNGLPPLGIALIVIVGVVAFIAILCYRFKRRLPLCSKQNDVV